MSGHRRDRSLPPMGTSNDERHSGHVDVAMDDPDCPFCNPEAHERSPGAAPLDDERAVQMSDEPRTESGKALLEWAETAYAGQDQLRIWRDHVLAIENEARAEGVRVTERLLLHARPHAARAMDPRFVSAIAEVDAALAHLEEDKQ